MRKLTNKPRTGEFWTWLEEVAPDALLFDGMSQMFSTHAILPFPNGGERINLTFRTGL